jgi:outer membrane protein OmpA-like peptidoglycan-associated protein
MMKMKYFRLFIIVVLSVNYILLAQDDNTISKVVINVKDSSNFQVPNIQFKILNTNEEIHEIAVTDSEGKYETTLTKGNSYIANFDTLGREVTYQFEVPKVEKLKTYQLVFKLPIKLGSNKVYSSVTTDEIDGAPRQVGISLTLLNIEKALMKNQKFQLLDTSNKLIFEGLTDENGNYNTALTEGQTYHVVTELYGEKHIDEFHISPGLKSYVYRLILPYTSDYKPKEPKGEPIKRHQDEKYKRTFTLDNITFATGKWDLKPSSFPSLDGLVEMMTDNPKMKIEIAGHTDDVGKDDANMILSQKRAETIVIYLVNNGISGDRLTPIGYGETMPIAPNTTAEGRQKNRRSEVRVIEE